MGAHSRPRPGLFTPAPGRHRGDLAPLVDIDVPAVAGRAAAGLVTVGAAGAVVVTGAGAALAAPAARAVPSYGAPSPTQLAQLRQCESSGNYAIDTGNGYYGAYQFDVQTWRSLGYGGYPNQASPATQDAAASQLEEERGWQPWPACSRKLGLTTSSAPSTNRGGLSTAVTPGASPVDRTLNRDSGAAQRTASHLVAGSVPAFGGTTLTTALVEHKRADVLVWQSRMARRGWTITVDGYFGPQSARVAREFAAEKKVAATAGTVDAAVWQAAWTAPIT